MKNLSFIEFHAINSDSTDYKLCHQRLGHVRKSMFIELKNKQKVHGINFVDSIITTDNLWSLFKWKQARLPFKNMNNKNNIEKPFFIVHSDVCSPINYIVNGKNSFVTFVDSYTHYCVTYLFSKNRCV